MITLNDSVWMNRDGKQKDERRNQAVTSRIFLSSSLWSSLVPLLVPDKARLVGGLTELS